MGKTFSSPFPDVAVPHEPITTYVLRHAARRDGHPALIDGRTGRTLTYRQLVDRVRRLAGGLVERGFRRGDVLALLAPNLPEFAVVFHGVAMAGGTVSTINPAFTEREIAHQLADVGARYIVTVPESRDAVSRCGAEIEQVFVVDPDTGDCPLYGPSLPRQVAIDPAEDVVAVPYSSGTTGLSKGVMLTHRNLAANIEQLGPLGQAEGQTVVAALPMFHIYGLQLLMNAPLAVGATVVTMPRFDLRRFLQLHDEHRAPRAYVVPPIMLDLARDPAIDEFDLSSVAEVFCAAAPLGAELELEVEARLGCRVVQGYGMTEASPATHLPAPTRAPGGSAGVLVPNTVCRIVDVESGRDLSEGEQGELWIRGPQVMKGYLGSESATHRVIDREGWLRTGDIGYVDGEGHFFIVDRLKEIIKVKGFQVAPAELESILLTHAAVADAAVVGAPDEQAGEVPVAFVVLKPAMAAAAEDLMSFVAGQAAGYKHIRRVEIVDAIPKSPSGKILRRVLRQRLT